MHALVVVMCTAAVGGMLHAGLRSVAGGVVSAHMISAGRASKIGCERLICSRSIAAPALCTNQTHMCMSQCDS
jgi:hypothetical protein